MSGTKGARAYKMKPETRKAVLDGLSDDEHRTSQHVAQLLGQTLRAVQLKLLRLLKTGEVQRCYIGLHCGTGGRIALWRKIPEGFIQPIYDPQPGFDARALDAAFGGSTFARKPASKPTTI